ncbi:MAG: sensor domain-containing diguanylate cyclase [Anaerolineae bacterium]|nr:MAG: sensor domain-containing diguanylate cyclase [Anaerolineae bacterium]
MKSPESNSHGFSLRDLLAFIPDAAILVDPDTSGILEANQLACNLYGYSHSEFVRLQVSDISADRNRSSRRMAEFRAGKFEPRVIIQHRRKDGEQFPAEICSTLISPDGEMRVILSTIRDYTVQRLIEDQLQKLNERMSITLRALPDLIFEFDSTGRYVDYYASRPDLLYRPFEEQIGRRIEEILPPEPAAVVRATFNEAVVSGSAKSPTYRLEIGGETHFFEMTLSRKTGPEGSELTFIALVRDVTERALIEQSLALSEANYRRLVNQSSDFILVTDPEGNITFANHSATRFSGYPEEELTKLHFLDIIAPDWKETVREIYVTQLETETPESICEYQLLRSDGEVVWVEQNISLIIREGKVEGFQGTLRDISARKSRELALASQMEVATEAAQTDSLTGLLNRRAILELAENELDVAGKSRQPLVFVIIDLDDLKSINDKYGHSQGDAYIQLFALTVSQNLRRSDHIGRVGGDEFLLLLPNTTSEGGKRVVKKILAASRRTRLGLPGGSSHPLNCSLGMAIVLPDQELMAASNYFDQADKALYTAKQSGKNTFVVYSDELK